MTPKASRITLRSIALGYLALLLVGPVGFVFYKTFEHGIAAAWNSVTTPEAQHAFWLTIQLVAIAVPLNTVFGVVMAIALVRQKWHGRGFVNSLIDLPFAISPVVVGRALILVYGRKGWFGQWLIDHGVQVIFSFPGMVLATIFVSLPFVVREVMPVLREAGTAQEQAGAPPGAGGPHARGVGMADVPADHSAVDPLGRRVRRRAHDGAGARGVRRRERRVRPRPRRDRVAAPPRRGSVPVLRPDR